MIGKVDKLPNLTELPGWVNLETAIGASPAIWEAANTAGNDAVKSIATVGLNITAAGLGVSGSLITAGEVIRSAAQQAATSISSSIAWSGPPTISQGGGRPNTISASGAAAYSAGQNPPLTEAQKRMQELTTAMQFVGYENGIDRVPKTDLYRLHEGERVVPKSENRTFNSKPINIQNVYNISSNMEDLLAAFKSKADESLKLNQMRGYI
jgi:hypothetical protein